MKVADIIQAVCDAYGEVFVDTVTPERVMSSQCQDNVVVCRYVAAYIMRTYGGSKYSAIGRVFNRNHATILYGVKKVNDWIDMGALEATVLGRSVEMLSVDGSFELEGVPKPEVRRRPRELIRILEEKNAELEARNARLGSEVARLNAVIKYALNNPKKRTQYREQRITGRPRDEYVKPINWTPEQLATLKEVRKRHLA